MVYFQITNLNTKTARTAFLERDGVKNHYYELGSVAGRSARVAHHSFGRDFDLGSLKVGESVITNGNSYKRLG